MTTRKFVHFCRIRIDNERDESKCLCSHRTKCSIQLVMHNAIYRLTTDDHKSHIYQTVDRNKNEEMKSERAQEREIAREWINSISHSIYKYKRIALKMLLCEWMRALEHPNIVYWVSQSQRRFRAKTQSTLTDGWTPPIFFFFFWLTAEADPTSKSKSDRPMAWMWSNTKNAKNKLTF